LYPDRQSIRLEAKGKSLKDTDNVKDLGKCLFISLNILELIQSYLQFTKNKFYVNN